MQASVNSNMTARTIKSILKQYTMKKPRIVFDKKHDRYTFVALIDVKGIKIILGAIYIRPTLLQDSTSSLVKQFNDLDKVLDSILKKINKQKRFYFTL